MRSRLPRDDRDVSWETNPSRQPASPLSGLAQGHDARRGYRGGRANWTGRSAAAPRTCQSRATALPAILHWDMSHFVVLKRIARTAVQLSTILHWASGNWAWPTCPIISAAWLSRSLHPLGSARGRAGGQAAALRIDRFGARPALSPWCKRWRSQRPEAYVLAGPFYMQLAVDEGVVNDDRSLLSVFALGFGLAMLFNEWPETAPRLAHPGLHLQSRIAFTSAMACSPICCACHSSSSSADASVTWCPASVPSSRYATCSPRG